MPILFCRPVLSLVIASSVWSASVCAQTYIASFSEAKWTVQSGAFACSVSHKIPGFGAAKFARRTGGAEVVELIPSGNLRMGGVIGIEAVPPVWRSEAAVTTLGQIHSDGKQDVRVTGAEVGKMSAALMQGTNVVFSSQRGDGTVLRVALEANNFEPAFARYKTCVSALIPHTFDQVARMLIGYAPGASELGSAAKAQLDNAIRYAKADPKVLGILVDAHSAPMTTREESDLASQRQAELVTSYLIAKGVSEESVNARWHGDKFPVAKNDTKAGQARNRRVTVRLETAATRAAMEKRIAAILAAEQQATALAAPEQTVAQQKSSDVGSGRSSARPETVTLDRPPPGKDVAAPDSLPLTLEQLEQMVEQQDLASGR